MTGFAPFQPDDDEEPESGALGLRDVQLRMIWPNLITVLAICAGLTGVRLAAEGDIQRAVLMVLLAAFLDGIDGRVARMLKASSRFGAHMDSLADIVNFGMAPALVLYFELLDLARPIGWIAALLYAIACGLRLARFNVMLETPDRASWRSDYFTGVPAPAGAFLVLLPVYLTLLGLPSGYGTALGASVYIVCIGLLMVSRIPVWSGKALGSKVRRDAVVPLLLLIVLVVLFLASWPWETLAVLATLYLACLPLSARAYARRLARERAEKQAEAD